LKVSEPPISLEIVVMTPSDQANRQFWLSRRQEAPQPRAKLSVAAFVQEANRQLQADKAYVPGTQFIVLPPPQPGGQEFPSWEGPQSLRPLIQRIFQGMTARFELSVAFRIDR
jgi:hypothetical protein